MSNFQQLIQEKKNKISELQLEINERQKDAPEVIPYGQGKYRLTRGNNVSDSRCENPFGAGGCGALGGDWFSREKEKASIWHKQNITPLENQKKNLNKEIIVLEEKAKLPILRQQIITATSEFEKLSPNDPEFRQKQIEQKKSLYEKAVALDTLERKHNLYGNLPTRPQQETTTITPEPIIQTEFIEEPINYKLIGAGAAIGLIALFLIWRFK